MSTVTTNSHCQQSESYQAKVTRRHQSTATRNTSNTKLRCCIGSNSFSCVLLYFSFLSSLWSFCRLCANKMALFTSSQNDFNRGQIAHPHDSYDIWFKVAKAVCPALDHVPVKVLNDMRELYWVVHPDYQHSDAFLQLDAHAFNKHTPYTDVAGFSRARCIPLPIYGTWKSSLKAVCPVPKYKRTA